MLLFPGCSRREIYQINTPVSEIGISLFFSVLDPSLVMLIDLRIFKKSLDMETCPDSYQNPIS